MRIFKYSIITLLVAATTVGCSSAFTSKKGAAKNGLNYYLPKKDLLVTVTVDKAQPTAITIGTTAAYPDLLETYVLLHNGNWVSKHESDISVNDAGLLTKSDSIQTSQSTSLAEAIGSAAAATVADEPADDEPRTSTECEPGTFSKTWKFEKVIVEENGPCGIKVTVEQLGTQEAVNAKGDPNPADTESGVYYRQNIPYRVTVKFDGSQVSKLILSPSESASYFLPAAKGFFASSESKFSFNDGVPEKFKTTSNGEVLGALTFPAEVIKGYFAAVGALFQSFSTADTNETTALQNELILEREKAKFEACIEAVKNRDTELLAALQCN